MNRYHTRSKFNPNCPQEDSREIAPNSLVYVQQRPLRHVSAFAGSPFALRSPEEQAAEQARIARLVPGWTP